MGLFDKVLGKGSDQLDVPEAFLAVALTAVAADGVLTQEEALGLTNILSRMHTFEKWTQKDLSKAMDKLGRVIKEGGVDTVLQAAAKPLPKELRPTAFAIAADLLLADGTVAETEKAYLGKLQGALGLKDDDALKIVEVLEIKNRG